MAKTQLSKATMAFVKTYATNTYSFALYGYDTSTRAFDLWTLCCDCLYESTYVEIQKILDNF